MSKAVVVLLGVAGLTGAGVAGGHYYLAGQTEQVYQTALDEANKQLADTGFPLNAEKVSFDGKIALTRITLPEELGDFELVVKQEITAGPLLKTADGMKPGLYAISTTLDKSSFPEEVVQGFRLRDGAKPLAIDTVIAFDETIQTNANIGAFVFEFREDEAVIIESDGFNLTNTSNKDQTSAKGTMTFGKVSAEFPDSKGKFLVAGGEAEVDAAEVLGSLVLDGTGKMTIGAMEIESPDANVLMGETLYEFSSRVQDGKIYRDDEMAFTGLTIDAPLPNGEEIKNWHMNIASNTSGFAVDDIERLITKSGEMNRVTASLMEKDPDNIDIEKYQQMIAEYFSAFMGSVKKDLSMAVRVDVGPENTDASMDLKLSYGDDLPLSELKTIGQLIEALKFDGRAVVPAALVENNPQAIGTLQQFTAMGFVKSEGENFSGQFNLANGKAKLNGEDFPIDMWVAGLRDQPLDLSLLQ